MDLKEQDWFGTLAPEDQAKARKAFQSERRKASLNAIDTTLTAVCALLTVTGIAWLREYQDQKAKAYQAFIAETSCKNADGREAWDAIMEEGRACFEVRKDQNAVYLLKGEAYELFRVHGRSCRYTDFENIRTAERPRLYTSEKEACKEAINQNADMDGRRIHPSLFQGHRYVYAF